MAIVRGGVRIGGIDVRVGIPRDITQILGGSDKRLKQKPGGNPESNMGSSNTSSIMFAFGSDFSVDLRCYDWDNELLRWQDYFQVGIDTTEYVEWNVEYHSNTTN